MHIHGRISMGLVPESPTRASATHANLRSNKKIQASCYSGQSSRHAHSVPTRRSSGGVFASRAHGDDAIAAGAHSPTVKGWLFAPGGRGPDHHPHIHHPFCSLCRCCLCVRNDTTITRITIMSAPLLVLLCWCCLCVWPAWLLFFCWAWWLGPHNCSHGSLAALAVASVPVASGPLWASPSPCLWQALARQWLPHRRGPNKGPESVT